MPALLPRLRRKALNVIYAFRRPDLSNANKSETSQTFLEANVDLGVRRIGAPPIYGGTSESDRSLGTSDWLPMPGVSPAELPTDSRIPYLPFTIEVTIEEAGERSELRNKLESGAEEVLKAIKQPLTEAVTDALKKKSEGNSGGN